MSHEKKETYFDSMSNWQVCISCTPAYLERNTFRTVLFTLVHKTNAEFQKSQHTEVFIVLYRLLEMLN